MAGTPDAIDDDPPRVEVDPGLCQARELLTDFLERPGFRFLDAEVLANLRAVTELVAVVEAARLGLIAEVGDRPGALPSPGRGKPVVTYLTQALHESRARAERDVAAATALMSARAELPLLAQALIDGQVSRDHVDVAVSTLGRLPASVKQVRVTDET